LGLPDEIGERGAAAIFFGFANAELGFAGFENAGLAEGLKQAVEEDLGFAFFIARDVGGGPGDKFLEAGFAVGGHQVSIHMPDTYARRIHFEMC
jgi:hypothetical protein